MGEGDGVICFPGSTRAAVEAIHDEEGDLLDALILTTPLIEGTLPAELVAQARIEAWVY